MGEDAVSESPRADTSRFSVMSPRRSYDRRPRKATAEPDDLAFIPALEVSGKRPYQRTKVKLHIHASRRWGKRPLLPHIARWVKPDVVVSAAGYRIDEHLEQWPAQASSEPVITDRPEVAPEATSTDTSH